MQLEDVNTHDNPPGISGALIEGRFIYDCFALVPKPTVGDMMSYKVDAALEQTYSLIIVDVFDDAGCTQFTNESSAPLATLTSPYFTVPVKLTKTTANLPLIIWNTNVTVPAP
ncbi:MAG: hypothetical protein HGB11_06460 [Chlorobiales bacterium]|nr:hypothetical protein [Chlorobiales bacterium]